MAHRVPGVLLTAPRLRLQLQLQLRPQGTPTPCTSRSGGARGVSARALAAVEDAARAALVGVPYGCAPPAGGAVAAAAAGSSLTVGAVGALRSVRATPSADGGVAVSAAVEVFSPATSAAAALQDAASEAVRRVAPAGTGVTITLAPRLHARPALAAVGGGCVGLGSVIAVASGKGGVGKSTVAVNLAYALAARGARVGLLDADIHGPSLPILVRPDDDTVTKGAGGRINALTAGGVRCMSYGWVAPKRPDGERRGAAMRGPLVSTLLQQLVKFTEWGVLDHLVVDMPPGTGDIHITLAQTLPITTAVIVTTPQALALADVVKGADLFAAMRVPTSAVVLNMAHFVAPDTGVTYYPFGADAPARVAAVLGRRMAVPALLELPMASVLAETSDGGTPLTSTATSIARGGGGGGDATAAALRASFDRLAVIAADAAEAGAAATDAGVATRAAAGAAPDSDDDGARVTATLDRRRSAVVVRVVTAAGAREEVLPSRALRLACRCAACQDETTGRPLLNPARVPADITPVTVTPQGNYAVAIEWSDGHASSIYPLTQLRQLAAAPSSAPATA